MKVIFACVHNAGRSQMASAFFNCFADSRKASAISAGTQPAQQVHEGVLHSMAEMGIDLSQIKPQRLTEELAADADLLITMGCGESCPVIPGLRREDWPLRDPKGLSSCDVNAVRDEIKARVLVLLDKLQAQKVNEYLPIVRSQVNMKIQVFDPPMCCSTGLCGPGIDPKLIDFAANLDWLKQQGIVVERYNLSQQPALFVANEAVGELLKKEGNACLPMILVDGEVATAGIYPSKNELAKIAGIGVSISETSCSSSSSSSSFNLTIKATPPSVAPANSSCCSAELAQEFCCDNTEEGAKQKKPCCS
jgi:protein-tyrosine-phosphatase